MGNLPNSCSPETCCSLFFITKVYILAVTRQLTSRITEKKKTWLVHLDFFFNLGIILNYRLDLCFYFAGIESSGFSGQNSPLIWCQLCVGLESCYTMDVSRFPRKKQKYLQHAQLSLQHPLWSLWKVFPSSWWELLCSCLKSFPLHQSVWVVSTCRLSMPFV